jgi:hypothetical protein
MPFVMIRNPKIHPAQKTVIPLAKHHLETRTGFEWRLDTSRR